MSATTPERRLTVSDIARMHADGQRIPMLTAYDYPTAQILDEAGIPMILVGDSLGEVLLGYESTVRVTMDEMLHHTKAVVRGTKRALVVGDMPFLTYATPEEALVNAGRFMREAGTGAVKVEGGVRSARIIETLVRAGIPVMGHIGWTPQAKYGMGGKTRVQGKDRDQARVDARRRARGAGGRRLRHRPGADARAAGGGHHRAAAHPDHRHRCRCSVARARSRSSPTCWAWARSSRVTPGPTPTCARPSAKRPARTPPTSRPATSRVPSRRRAWTRRCWPTRWATGDARPAPVRAGLVSIPLDHDL